MFTETIHSLQSQGYDPVYVWDGKPNEVDEEHSHEFETKLHVLEGEIHLKITGDKDYTLKSGDELDIPKGQIHSAITGPEGCKYIVAEKHSQKP